MLELQALTVQFGGLRALDEVSFAVRQGEIVGLIGPNGAGKTTVFNAISRFILPTHGSIHFIDQDVLNVRAHRLIDLGIARTFQNLGLFPFLSVTDNLLLGQHHHFKTRPLSQMLGVSVARKEEAQLKAQAVALLEQVGLETLKDAYVMNLPYGVQKFVEVCRALASSPKLLLLDEPAAGLTSAETEQMRHLILRARDEFEMTVLLIEHDMALVMRSCNRVVALDFGKVIAQGTPEEIQHHPQVIEAYLGQTEATDA